MPSLLQGHDPVNLSLLAEEANSQIETVASLDQSAYVGRWYQVGHPFYLRPGGREDVSPPR